MGHFPASTSDLVGAPDDELDQQPWTTPVLVNPAFHVEKPPAAARCTACHGHHFWQEASGQKFGWRCATCIPAVRPPDRITIVDTMEPATT
jgi:hypothetical protein